MPRLSYLSESLLLFDFNKTIRYFFVIYLTCVVVNIVGVAILEFIVGPKISVELGSPTEPDLNVTVTSCILFSRFGPIISAALSGERANAQIPHPTIDFHLLLLNGPTITSVPTEKRNLVTGYGYPFESHEVISGSGYILTLHRIPHGIKQKHWKRATRPVALFQHGLVASSDAFLFRGPDFDLPYIMADEGYDVWLSNMRGNVYSRKHKTMDSAKDLEFWDFSLHEVGVQDYPAIFDYILNKTNQQDLYFLGHSVGSTAGFILCAAMPEYNKKIKLHLSLAPLVYVNHSITFGQKMLILPGVSVTETAMANGIYNFFPRRPFFSRLLQMICKDGMPLQRFCLYAVFTVVGQENTQFNTSYLPSCFEYFPAGTSMYLMQHTLQLYVKGDFSPFDYGNGSLNMQKYNDSVPVPYNLSMVTHPVSLHYGSGDILVTEQDIDSTVRKLPNSIGKYKVPFENFNHMDFMWGKDAKELLYDKLITMMDKYR